MSSLYAVAASTAFNLDSKLSKEGKNDVLIYSGPMLRMTKVTAGRIHLNTFYPFILKSRLYARYIEVRPNTENVEKMHESNNQLNFLYICQQHVAQRV